MRGLSRLYSAALRVLEREGSDCPARRVANQLLNREKVLTKLETTMLYWKSADGMKKSTSFIQFQKQLTNTRKRIK